MFMFLLPISPALEPALSHPSFIVNAAKFHLVQVVWVSKTQLRVEGYMVESVAFNLAWVCGVMHVYLQRLLKVAFMSKVPTVLHPHP